MKSGGLIGPVIIAIGLVAAAIVFAVVATLLEDAGQGLEPRIARLESALEEAEARERRLKSDIDRLGREIEDVRKGAALRATADSTPTGDDAVLPLDSDFGEHSDTEEPTEEMILAKQNFNRGVTQPNSRFMVETLGHPRDNYSQTCQSVTNPRLKAAMETREVGPIRVTMLKPALASLERVFKRLAETDPDILDKIGTAGALCVRNIRGSTRAVSNHSWGTAIDITIEGVLDGFADGGTQFGLLILAEYFNDEGWYWGATYGREDSMHFEVGVEQVLKWIAAGEI